LWINFSSPIAFPTLLPCVYHFIPEKSKTPKLGGGGTIRLCWYLSSLHLTQELSYYRYVV